MQIMLPKEKSEALGVPESFVKQREIQDMILPRIQYITHPEEDFSNLNWVESLANGGVSWIQLRIKEEDLAHFHPSLHYKATLIDIADALRSKTKELGMLLTINDHPDVARLSGADGIHLGVDDVVESSETIDFDIYGGTAHDLVEMNSHPISSIDYFGVGPFQQTRTKKKIKPVLGLSGYRNLMVEMVKEGIDKPVFAIGGIAENDISHLMKTGVYGIALSGLIHRSGFDEKMIENIVNKTKIYE